MSEQKKDYDPKKYKPKEQTGAKLSQGAVESMKTDSRMKKIVIVFLVIVLLIAVAYFIYVRIIFNAYDLSKQCELLGGKWFSKAKECEAPAENWCERNGGTYNSCASACRGLSAGSICTEECVPVCKF